MMIYFVLFLLVGEATANITTANPKPKVLDADATASYSVYVWFIAGIVSIVMMITVIAHQLLKVHCHTRYIIIW